MLIEVVLFVTIKSNVNIIASVYRFAAWILSMSNNCEDWKSTDTFMKVFVMPPLLGN